MIRASLIWDDNWIQLGYDNYIEMGAIRSEFTRRLPRWFIIKKKSPSANVEETFVSTIKNPDNTETDVLPVGLWYALVLACQKRGFSITFETGFNEKIKNTAVTREKFDRFLTGLFSESDMKVRDYQADAAFNALSYKRSCLEVSTSGGKTFMTYILFKYMTEVLGLKHILYVTPKTVLTTQSSDKFAEYDERGHRTSDWTYNEIHAMAKKQDEYNETIVFGNYQSLCRKNAEFFKKYDAVIVDECHHSAAKSIRGILDKCVNAMYKIGLTGTFPEDDTYENMVIQSYIGPVVYRLTSYELINEKKCATPVYVTTLLLKYLDDKDLGELYKYRVEKDKEDPAAGNGILNIEKGIARNNKTRFKYICNMLMNTTKNTLGIFSDVQNNYGRTIYEYVKENSDKTVFYIDGDTPDKSREYAKQYMENDESGNTIIIASMQCFTEGIDIANMWNIFLLETTKSDNTLAQLLGRGMRSHPKKDKTIMIDFVDDFRYCTSGGAKFKNNYLFKHAKERMKIYMKRGFPCSTYEVDLKTNTTQRETDLLA